MSEPSDIDSDIRQEIESAIAQRITDALDPAPVAEVERWLGPAFIEALARLDGKHLGRTPSVADVCGVLERQGFVRADPTDRSEP